MSESYSEQRLSLAELVVQTVTYALFIILLVFFIYRLYRLRSLSMTQRYQGYFPRVRIILSLLYIIVSIIILAFSISFSLYPPSDWYWYLLEGGGGGSCCINSLVLVFQMLVLRQQLLKERPFTRIHFLFFLLLAMASNIRLVQCILNASYSNKYTKFIPLFSLLVAISDSQLVCWIIIQKKLPQFHKHEEIHINTAFINESISPYPRHNSIMTKIINEQFPYLLPFVTIEYGLVRITLEKYQKKSQFISSQQQSEKMQVSSGRIKENTLQSSLKLQKKDSEFISVSRWSAQQVKRFYILCGRFAIKRKIDFDTVSLQRLAISFQQFLEQMLSHKHFYQSQLLRQLQVPQQYLQLYEKYQKKQFREQQVRQSQQKDDSMSQSILDDANATYCSISIFRHLWITDHYEMYIKANMISTCTVTYPIKRYTDFEQLDYDLRHIIKSKDKSLELPSLPKKHLFHWDQDDYIDQKTKQLDKYLKRLTNDYTLMKLPEIRWRVLQFLDMRKDLELVPQLEDVFYISLQIVKGGISKVMVKSECVTFYEFKVLRDGLEIKSISKRYSEIEELHREVKRWMNNIRTTFSFLVVPDKVYFGSEASRHEKLVKYIQNLVDIRGIGRVFEVNKFFNVRGHQNERMIESSDSESQRVKKSNRRMLDQGMIEMQERGKRTGSKYSNFSHILDNLSNDDYYL